MHETARSARLTPAPCNRASNYPNVATHAARSRGLASPGNLRAPNHRAPGALGARSLAVSPTPLPPDVANNAIRADEKSPDSKNVLTMFGAVYHQMGKPINTVLYALIPSGMHFSSGLHEGSLHSRVLLLLGSVQSRSAGAYASIGAISNTSAPVASASRCARRSVTPLAEKYATSVFPDMASSLVQTKCCKNKRSIRPGAHSNASTKYNLTLIMLPCIAGDKEGGGYCP